ncbi:putative ABC transporter-binding protein DR_1438 [Rubrivivax sp. A210]|uniref:ABC transporter substrate-binding protein n=1 Tax=Rubrivivax sp. A210 TaxID=2772301 RepID=UPI00191A38E8|nr:ABC transporter substrate-binding protein [Rubrivivax sp. A210]CAD5366270.1 putative ABC transporter-binding protein DR_1438 [Rubrivivax sp. A210]
MTKNLTRIAAAALLAAGFAGAQAATLTISCGSNAADVEFCGKFAEEWGKKNGHTVKMYSPPASTTDNLALLRQQFAAKSADIDVIMIDVVWPGVIKDHLVDLKKYSKGAEGKHFPAIVANNTVDGKLLGMPWFTDAGLLFYRKDLLDKHGLKAPETWDQLSAAAKKVMDAERAAGNADFQGFVFQAKAYEGLTCDAVEWVASFGGGTIVDKAGNITINNPNAAKALDTAAAWIGTIAPSGVLNYGEEDARGVFQNGKALFMRNWPYAWALSQAADSPIKGKVGVAPLPAGSGGKAATLGGWQLAVSKYSKNVDAAADLVMFMAGADIQKKRAIGGSYNPTIPDLYKDKEVLAANPFMGQLLDVFTGAVARPATVTGLKYPEVSRAFWDAAHDVLEKKSNGTDAVKRLEGKLKQVKRDKW